MRIAIPSNGDGLTAQVARQFGRCDSFLFVDSETLEWEVVPNEAKHRRGGAGIAAAQQVIDGGADAVLAGVMGPNALDVLTEAQIPVYEDLGGTVIEAVEMLASGELERGSRNDDIES
jgi:predicted Fe-Mo cluster-binding NifX family protein